MRRIVLSSVARLAVRYYFTFSYIRHDFREKTLLNVTRMFCFSLQRLSESCLILRRIQRDIVINVHRLHVKYLLFSSGFNET
jgi:hypothetical protein